MVRHISVFLVLCFALSTFGVMVGQELVDIEGRILDEETREPIAYANVYNKDLNRGTLSHSDGFFRLAVRDASDRISISFIGYEEYVMLLEPGKQVYTVYLKESTIELAEVTIRPKDDSYLYNLIRSCKSSQSRAENSSKAYFELKSYTDGEQIELVESYFNVDVRGYDVDDLHMKAGRLALMPMKNQFFGSLGSSRAIIMLSLFNKSNYFPINPFQLSHYKLKRTFYLSLDNKFLNEVGDSIFVVDYMPKANIGEYFEGKVWINATQKSILKITMNCVDTDRHPFLPIFPHDEILGLSFNITQTFNGVEGDVVFNHIDLIYEMDYVRRRYDEENIVVRTEAILYAYDYDQAFFIPKFKFYGYDIDDYRKISAMPYNEFFWKYNDEYGINDSLNSNELFFSDELTMTNTTMFTNESPAGRSFYEHPYIKWSEEDRIKLRATTGDAAGSNDPMTFKSEAYKLAIQIYLDVNSYQDSLDIVTATIFDPYETFYNLTMDESTYCFINIYFDLFEIKRREIEQNIRDNCDHEDCIKTIYDKLIDQLEMESQAYLKAVQRGTNEKAMREYNSIVLRALGIDNIQLFKPFE